MQHSAVADWRSDCPISCALDLIGDRWTLLVLRDLFFGAHYFDELSKSAEGIASNVLGDRLRKLEREGLISRAPDREDGRRVRYALTARGKSLEPVLAALARWGVENVPGTRPRVPLSRLYGGGRTPKTRG